ncbi:uncharacterized protein LOC114360933 [Ostrinia furnacalis]|uniref:uncharacterized protein LOC114360933 n=1 Tax=Ostrinia furnacalis TaxID=93504 RepID=UPI00103AC460|nr:uncharacterized protein LOC114360933 [Ostrinia furnacalis]
MLIKIVAIIVIISCAKAEESNAFLESILNVDSKKEAVPDILNEVDSGDIASGNNVSPIVDETLIQGIKKASEAFMNIVNEADKKWRDWVKHYNCTTSSGNLVGCVTSVKALKSLCSWKEKTSQVEIPTEPPSDVDNEFSNGKWSQKITSDLEKWFADLKNLVSKAKEIINNKKIGIENQTDIDSLFTY